MAKILIVDDDQLQRDTLRGWLEKAGHVVVEGDSGNKGIEVAKQNMDIDLLISDFYMPGMAGDYFCKLIRGIPEFKELPIFFCTTESNPFMKKKGDELKVEAWIVKPVVEANLVAAVQKVLEKSGK